MVYLNKIIKNIHIFFFLHGIRIRDWERAKLDQVREGLSKPFPMSAADWQNRPLIKSIWGWRGEAKEDRSVWNKIARRSSRARLQPNLCPINLCAVGIVVKQKKLDRWEIESRGTLLVHVWNQKTSGNRMETKAEETLFDWIRARNQKVREEKAKMAARLHESQIPMIFSTIHEIQSKFGALRFCGDFRSKRAVRGVSNNGTSGGTWGVGGGGCLACEVLVATMSV